MGDEKSADKLMKEAEKYLKPSLLSGRFKPDWDEAYPLFEKAAVQYRVAGCSAKAIEAYEKAARANVRGRGTAWHAAKSLEAAAQICKDQRDSERSADFAKQAAEHYVSAGKAASGAECLARAARWLEGPSASTSGRLYKDALALYAKDPMGAMAHDLVQRGVGIQLQQGKVDDAIDMLMQWGSICGDTKSDTNLCRAYLGVIVLHLHKGNAPAAWAAYQDFLDVEEFSNSAEAMSAENLLDGYKSGDAATIKQRLGQGRCWGNLDSAVARVAKALPSKDADLTSMAQFLRSKMSDGDDAADAAPENEDGELDLT